MKLKNPLNNTCAHCGHVSDKSIPVRNLKDGQVAVITYWGVHESYVGRIVQRNENRLVSVGMGGGHTWQSILSHDSLRVQVLPEGTELVA